MKGRFFTFFTIQTVPGLQDIKLWWKSNKSTNCLIPLTPYFICLKQIKRLTATAVFHHIQRHFYWVSITLSLVAFCI